MPGTASLFNLAKLPAAPNAPSPTSSGVWFDARGAVKPPSNTWTVDVFYLGSAVAPDAGYRAVLLMPAGSIEVWTSDTSGSWQQLR